MILILEQVQEQPQTHTQSCRIRIFHHFVFFNHTPEQNSRAYYFPMHTLALLSFPELFRSFSGGLELVSPFLISHQLNGTSALLACPPAVLIKIKLPLCAHPPPHGCLGWFRGPPTNRFPLQRVVAAVSNLTIIPDKRLRWKGFLLLIHHSLVRV